MSDANAPAGWEELVEWFAATFPRTPSRFVKPGDSFVDRLAMVMMAVARCERHKLEAMKDGLKSLMCAEPVETSSVRRIDEWLNPGARFGGEFSELLRVLMTGAFSTSGAAAIGRGEFLFWMTCPGASLDGADFRDREGRAFNLKTLKACIAPGSNAQRGRVPIDEINAETWGPGVVPGQKKSFVRWSADAMAAPEKLNRYLKRIFPEWAEDDIQALAVAASDYETFNAMHGILCMKYGAQAASLRGYIMIDTEAAEVISILREDFDTEVVSRLRLRFRSHLSRKNDTNSTPEGYSVVDRAPR